MGEAVFRTHFQGSLPSGKEFRYANDHIGLGLEKRSLFDTLHLRFEKKMKGEEERFVFHHTDYPIRRRVKVTLKPTKSYGPKARVYSVYGKKYSFASGKWENGAITFSTRSLGAFTIKEDTVPPTITAKQLNTKKVIFIIDDQLSGIQSYKAYSNGEWLLMKYDMKRKRLESVLKNENKTLRGEFKLEVYDNAGNKRIYERTITES